MISRSAGLNTVVGFFVALSGAAGYAWTFTSRLRSMELFVPRIALILIAAGGGMIVLQDLIKGKNTENVRFTGVLPYAACIVLVMWLYGWAFRTVGLMTSTFVFLSAWWLWVVYRGCASSNDFSRLVPRIFKMLALAAVTSVVVRLLFIELLGMYMPRTLLP